VSIDALAAIADKGHQLWPKTATIALVQDKLRQKQTFADAGLPVPRFADVPSQEALREFGFPAVLKKRRNSYDGKGNATLRSESDIPVAWSQLGGADEALYAEEFCNFTMELALIVTRGQDGTMVSYPVVETMNREHICHIVKAPAEIPAAVAATATDIAMRAVKTIGGVGSFGVELFYLSDGRILMNEIAPRVHNTGHYTIEACLCSQFENHVRAVLGWPLGPTNMVAPAACMVNLLGYGGGSGAPLGLREAMSIPGAHVHVYGKTRSARGRKMGHVTALGQTIEEARARAQQAADCIQFGGE
jgi:5-(carboxyamino)imidazole ribonucleotide synthase